MEGVVILVSWQMEELLFLAAANFKLDYDQILQSLISICGCTHPYIRKDINLGARIDTSGQYIEIIRHRIYR